MKENTKANIILVLVISIVLGLGFSNIELGHQIIITLLVLTLQGVIYFANVEESEVKDKD